MVAALGRCAPWIFAGDLARTWSAEEIRKLLIATLGRSRGREFIPQHPGLTELRRRGSIRIAFFGAAAALISRSAGLAVVRPGAAVRGAIGVLAAAPTLRTMAINWFARGA